MLQNPWLFISTVIEIIVWMLLGSLTGKHYDLVTQVFPLILIGSVIHCANEFFLTRGKLM
jgi:ABC-type Fe3+-siderophore transport system permease subunit